MTWTLRFATRATLVLPAGIHVHHHFHGLAGGYVGLGVAALASWIGLPGPGEAALVTAAIVAQRGRLDIAEVVLVAWAAATVGGIAGWVVGLKGGRVLITTRGPLHRSRLRALERGERVYERFGIVAVLFTPSWMAGIAEMPWSRYFVANLLSALSWALIVGVGAYFAGPPIVKLVDDFGLAGLLVVLALVGAGALLKRRRRRTRG
jgi:membrane protein DedA with SNARE-associated domain